MMPNGPSRPRIWRYLLIFAVAWGIGMALSPLRRPGGDSNEMQLYVQSVQSVFYVRSPLTLYLHRGAYHLIQPFGGTAATAMALCSSAAGGVYLLALLNISRHPLFLLFNLFAGTTFLFFGHLENYSWVNAMLVVYLALLKRHVEGRAPLWPAASALLLACLFHMLAVFTLPTLLPAIWSWNQQRRRFAVSIERRDFERVLMAFVATALIVALGPLLLQPAGLDNNTQRIVPLFHNPNPIRYFFTMFSLEHLQMLAYFHLKASPLGLIVLLALGWKINTRFERFALGAALCGLFWTSIWHPDMGRADWDLFSSFAFPLDILGGLLLAKTWNQYRRASKEAKNQDFSANSLDAARKS